MPRLYLLLGHGSTPAQPPRLRAHPRGPAPGGELTLPARPWARDPRPGRRRLQSPPRAARRAVLVPLAGALLSAPERPPAWVGWVCLVLPHARRPCLDSGEGVGILARERGGGGAGGTSRPPTHPFIHVLTAGRPCWGQALDCPWGWGDLRGFSSSPRSPALSGAHSGGASADRGGPRDRKGVGWLPTPPLSSFQRCTG